jgi:hypothetical protein
MHFLQECAMNLDSIKEEFATMCHKYQLKMSFKGVCYNIMIGIIMFVLPVMMMQYMMDYHQQMVDFEVSLYKQQC